MTAAGRWSDSLLVWNGVVVSVPPREHATSGTRCATLGAYGRRALVEWPRGSAAAGEEACMHARIARYSFSGDGAEIARKA